MSYPLGTKVRLKSAWRGYTANTVLEQGFYADLESLVHAGLAERVEAETPARPAKLARAAAKKVADGVKRLL